MTAWLMHYGGYRYTMELASGYRMGSPFDPDPQKKAAADAGRAMLDAVYPDVWERNAERVKRVEDFLVASFPYYRKGNAHHTLDALRRAVRNGDVHVVEREPEYRGGFAAAHSRAEVELLGRGRLRGSASLKKSRGPMYPTRRLPIGTSGTMPTIRR